MAILAGVKYLQDTNAGPHPSARDRTVVQQQDQRDNHWPASRLALSRAQYFIVAANVQVKILTEVKA